MGTSNKLKVIYDECEHLNMNDLYYPNKPTRYVFFYKDTVEVRELIQIHCKPGMFIYSAASESWFKYSKNARSCVARVSEHNVPKVHKAWLSLITL